MITVLLNDKENVGRKSVEAELLKEKPTCVWVRLPDGNVIRRKKNRDIVK